MGTPSPMGTSSSPSPSGASSTFSPTQSEASLDMSTLIENIPSNTLATLLNARPPSSKSPRSPISPTSMETGSSPSSTSPTSPASMESHSMDDGLEKVKKGGKKKNRCQECRKKVGLTGFPCRCGGL